MQIQINILRENGSGAGRSFTITELSREDASELYDMLCRICLRWRHEDDSREDE